MSTDPVVITTVPLVQAQPDWEKACISALSASEPSITSYWLSSYTFDFADGESHGIHSTVSLSRTLSVSGDSGITAAAEGPEYRLQAESSTPELQVTVQSPRAQTVTFNASSPPKPDGGTCIVMAPSLRFPDAQGSPLGTFRSLMQTKPKRGSNDITDDLEFEPSGNDDAKAGSDRVVYDERGIPVTSVPSFISTSSSKCTNSSALPSPGEIKRRAILSASLCPSTGLVLTGGEAGSLRVWHHSTGALVADLSPPIDPPRSLSLLQRGHLGDITASLWLPNGSIALTAATDCLVRLWAPFLPATIGGARCIAAFAGHSRPPTALALLAGTASRQFASSGRDGRVLLWDTALAAGPSTRGQTTSPLGQWGADKEGTTGEERPLWSLACSHDGVVLAAGSDDGCVDIIDTRHPRKPVFSSSAPRSVDMAKTAITATGSRDSRLPWALAASPVGVLSVPIAPVAFARTPPHATHGTSTGTEGLWHTIPSSGARLASPTARAVRALTFASSSGSNSNVLLAGMDSGLVAVIDLRMALGAQYQLPQSSFCPSRAAVGGTCEEGSGRVMWHDWGEWFDAASSISANDSGVGAPADAAASATGNIDDDDANRDFSACKLPSSNPVRLLAGSSDAPITSLVLRATPSPQTQTEVWVGDDQGTVALWCLSGMDKQLEHDSCCGVDVDVTAHKVLSGFDCTPVTAIATARCPSEEVLVACGTEGAMVHIIPAVPPN